MKQIYTAIALVLSCGPAVFAGSHFTARKTAPALQAVKPQGLWQPLSQQEYLNIDGEWINLGDTRFVYDERGNALETIVEDEDGWYKLGSTYNEYNQPLTVINYESTDGEGWENVAKTTYKYDPVLHSYVVERMSYDFNGHDWETNFKCEVNDVTRNSAGNITEIVKSLPLGAMMVPGYKLTWTYDETTGKAVGMGYYLNYNDDDVLEWTLNNNTDYRNIVWHRTDGQMTYPDLSAYIEGDNMITSCDIYYNGEIDGHFYVTHGDDGTYKAVETFLNINEIGKTVEKMYIEGSTSDYEIITSEYFDDNNMPTSSPQYIVRITYCFNDRGDIILNEKSEKYKGRPEEIVDGYEYSYTYDENGNVKEFVQSVFDYDSGEYIEDVRIIYGEYAQFSGLEDITADEDAAVEYFDLQGRRVDKPATGLYIRRQGSKADKVLVK